MKTSAFVILSLSKDVKGDLRFEERLLFESSHSSGITRFRQAQPDNFYYSKFSN